MATPLGGQFNDRYHGKSQSYTCCIIVAVCCRHQLTSNFNRASLSTTSTVWTQWRSASISTSCGPIHCIWVPGEITCSPVLGSINFCWYFCTTIHSCCVYTCSHILHILWGSRVVASFKPLRDSGYTSWVPSYIMPKEEPTRSNMAPRSMERPKAAIVCHIFKKWIQSCEQEIQFYSIAMRDLILVCFYY